MDRKINNKKDRPYTMMEGRTKEWGRLSSPEQGDSRKFTNPSTDHPYYDRKSKEDSFKIAVIAVIGIIVLLIGMGVLEMIKTVSE